MKRSKNRCSICGKKGLRDEAIIEARPTGEFWAQEEWAYCVECWFGMEQLRRQRLDADRLLGYLDHPVAQ